MSQIPDLVISRHERPVEHPTWIDEAIQAAQENGDFDDLPGAGKPIPGAGKRDDDLWWVRSWLRRNSKSENTNRDVG